MLREILPSKEISDMKVWTVCLVAVFGMVELYQWFQDLALPLPIYGAAGLLLALISNANHWSHYFLEKKFGSLRSRKLSTQIGEVQDAPEVREVREKVELPPALNFATTTMAQSQTQGEPQLPNLPVSDSPSISFTVHKP